MPVLTLINCNKCMVLLAHYHSKVKRLITLRDKVLIDQKGQ